MGNPAFLLAVLLAATFPPAASAAPAASSATESETLLFDFPPRRGPATFRGVDATVEPAGPADRRVLRVSTRVAKGWPGVTLTGPAGGWNLGAAATVEVLLHNPGNAEVKVFCRVDNPGADGTKHCVTGELRLGAGKDGVSKVGLERAQGDTFGGELLRVAGLPGAVRRRSYHRCRPGHAGGSVRQPAHPGACVRGGTSAGDRSLHAADGVADRRGSVLSVDRPVGSVPASELARQGGRRRGLEGAARGRSPEDWRTTRGRADGRSTGGGWSPARGDRVFPGGEARGEMVAGGSRGAPLLVARRGLRPDARRDAGGRAGGVVRRIPGRSAGVRGIRGPGGLRLEGALCRALAALLLVRGREPATEIRVRVEDGVSGGRAAAASGLGLEHHRQFVRRAHRPDAAHAVHGQRPFPGSADDRGERGVLEQIPGRVRSQAGGRFAA